MKDERPIDGKGSEEDGYGYLDDSPQNDPDADRLGHARFASKLARTLAALQAPEGYVLGLHGPWGSGKSSVLNFVKSEFDRMKRAGEPVPAIVEFAPWIISGHQDVTAAFMKVLVEQLPKQIDSIAKRLLRGAGGASDDVLDAVAKIGVLTDHTGGIATKGATGIAKKAIDAAKKRWLDEPSLQGTYDRLVTALRSQAQRFVVLIDDIDRLTSGEIQDLMRMVKTIGRLPNVTYVLAYDRAVVWKALAPIDPAPRSGAFAEKIVQQEVELPTPTKRALLAMLGEALAFTELPPDIMERRAQLVDSGLSRWVRQPRDVVRLANALRFLWSTLRDELDPDDLVCMEGLRLYDRGLFDWVRDNREILLEDGFPMGEAARQAAAAEVRELFPASRCKAGELLTLLFPNRAELFLDKGRISAEAWGRVVARRGVATRAGYEAYFGFHPGSSAIPKSIADHAVSPDADEDGLRAIISDAVRTTDDDGDTIVGTLLDELRSRIEAGAEPADNLLVALVREGTAITTAAWSGDALGPRSQLHFLVFAILERWDEARRIAVLQAAYAAPSPLTSVAAVHVDLARAGGLLPAKGVSRRDLVQPAALAELSARLLRRLDPAIAEGRLDDIPEYHNVASVWAMRDGAEPPRRWLTRLAGSSGARLARIASGFLGYSRSSDGRRYGIFSRPDDLYDVDALLDAARKFEDDPDLKEDQRRRIQALARELPEFIGSGSATDRDGS